jgi:colanic acid biosynthesis glycosyl transferase WcaI
MQKKVVLVSQVFYPDTTATSQLFTELFARLSDERDVSIEVICGFPTTRSDNYTSPDRVECKSGIKIYHCGIDMPSKGNYLFRAICYFSFLAHAGIKLMFTSKNAIVFGVTNPPFLCILLWIVSSLRRTKYHYMFQDIYPEGLVALGKMNTSSIVFKLWHFLNKISYSRADLLPVLGRDMVPLLEQSYSIPKHKTVYIPHWSPTATIAPKSILESNLYAALPLQDKFVIQYSGNMGLWHDIDSFVLTAKKLETYPDIQFLFIGGGKRKQKALELAQQERVTNIIWKDFVLKEELVDSLACCHVSLITLREGLSGIAVPSKLYGILASGRATIAQVPNDSEIALVVKEEHCGLVVEPGDVDGLVRAILDLYKDRQLAQTMGHKAFQAYQTKYTSECAIERFKKLFGLN